MSRTRLAIWFAVAALFSMGLVTVVAFATLRTTAPGRVRVEASPAVTTPAAAPSSQPAVAPAVATEAAPQPHYYTVTAYDSQRGEGALSFIAAKFHTTVQQLVEWNHIADPNRISVGQRLRVD